MDLEDQLKKLFPDHVPSQNEKVVHKNDRKSLQDAPIICKFEKRKGKPITILEGFEYGKVDLKALAKELKTKLSVGGSFKDGKIIIQGNYRDKIMTILKDKGFAVKRVGG